MKEVNESYSYLKLSPCIAFSSIFLVIGSLSFLSALLEFRTFAAVILIFT